MSHQLIVVQARDGRWNFGPKEDEHNLARRTRGAYAEAADATVAAGQADCDAGLAREAERDRQEFEAEAVGEVARAEAEMLVEEPEPVRECICADPENCTEAVPGLVCRAGLVA
jgi:hypothetical protein